MNREEEKNRRSPKGDFVLEGKWCFKVIVPLIYPDREGTISLHIHCQS